ncbi:MAG TPA: GNAT family N-acetyltransferase [Terriglobia bacterium]|nr:GNAT family N-acetyltransferase [Terriglobia bacterium]
MTGAAYHLRPARPDEVGVVRAIEQAAAQRFRGTDFDWVANAGAGSVADVTASIAAQQVLVMTPAGGADAGQPVAFVQFAIVDGGAYIEEIDVLPTHAGHRLAARLIDAVDVWARSQGLPILTLSTFSTIPWNAPYYRRLGFRDMGHLGPGLAAIRERHRALGLKDEQRAFLWRPVAR